MNFTSCPKDSATLSSEFRLAERERLVGEVVRRSKCGKPFDARSILEEHPEMNWQKSAILDLAYEEFCCRLERGESVDPCDFASRFPAINDSLLRLIGVHQLLHDGGGAADFAAKNAWPVSGDKWLEFKLIEELGRGAFSRVFLAREQALGDRLVVVKATSLGAGEAVTLGRLGHRNVVPIHSVRRDEQLGLTAVCMPFLTRVSLFDVIEEIFSSPKLPIRADAIINVVRRLNSERGRQGPVDDKDDIWSPRETYRDGMLKIAIQLTEALGHAHQHGVLHCDVKPSNILLTDQGRALLLDFNLACGPDNDIPLVGGTLPYMAPEQLKPLVAPGIGHSPSIDPRTDIFALGVTLYEFSCGRSPFGRLPDLQSREAIVSKLLERQRQGPIGLEEHGARIDRRVAAIINRCLEFDPYRRPQSMDELRHLLSQELRTANCVRRWFASHRRLTTMATAAACTMWLAFAGWISMREPFPIREFREGQKEYSRGNIAAAEWHLSAALDNDSQFGEARLFRACTRFRRGDFVGAYADFESLSKNVSDGRVTIGLAHIVALARTDFGRAAVLYRQAIEQGYGSAIIYNNLGYCLTEAGEFREAVAALQRATYIDPWLPAAHQNLARAELSLAQQEQRTPDITFITRAVQLGPDTTALELDAASTFAAFADSVADESQQRTAVDTAFSFLQRAVDRGIAPDQLDTVSSLNQSLKGDPRWDVLVIHSRLGTRVEEGALLLDPLSEILGRGTAAPPSAIAGR